MSDGFLEAGYNRIHIDDCWMEKSRDEHGRLVADRKRFPSGMKNLAKYVRYTRVTVSQSKLCSSKRKRDKGGDNKK